MKLLKNIKPELFFLLFGLFFGSLHLFINPPLQAPDEFNHFCRAYQVSEGKFVAEKNNRRLGGNLPESFQSFFVTYRFAATHPEYRFTSFVPDETSCAELESDKKVFTDFANTAYYSPVSYAPQALTMFILRQFNAMPLTMYFATRFMVFLFWLLGIYYAIKTSPVFKWLLCFLALLPINFIIGVSLSADTVTNVLAFGFIASVLKLAYGNGAITTKKIVGLIIIACLLALAKLVYVGLVLLFFIIPVSKFGNRKKRIFSFAGIFIPAFLLALWWSAIASALYIPYSEYNPDFVQHATLARGNNYRQQLNLILSDKTYFIKVIINSIFNPEQVYLSSYIGVYGAYMAFVFPLWIYVVAYIGVFFVSFSIETPPTFKLKNRIVLLVAATGTFVVLLLSLHLIWDPVGSGYVWLLQGRYLVPVVPLILMAIGGWLKVKPEFAKLVLIIIILIVNVTAAVLIHGQYIAEQHNYVYKGFSGLEEKNGNGDFVSDNPNIVFSNQSNYSALQKRHGNSSALLSPAAPYGLSCKLKGISKDDVIEVDLWKKGRGGVAIISGGGTNCKGYTAPNGGFDFVDSNGWKKVHYLLHVTSVCDNSSATFYMYQPDADSVFVDDITLIHKTNIKK